MTASIRLGPAAPGPAPPSTHPYGCENQTAGPPDGLALAAALVVLAATLGAAVARPRYLSEAVAAAAGAPLLVAVGAVGLSRSGDALRDLAPTVGFLAALLVIAEGCRREGLFEAMGAAMARGSRGSPRRLLAFVFVIAAGITALLSLDATVVLLTPVVFATAARMRTSPRPHVYGCSHLANSASLLLPVSNLTNLLAFHASGLSFARFAALMALPTIAAVGVEWVVISRFFAIDLRRPRHDSPRPARPELPRFAVEVLAHPGGGPQRPRRCPRRADRRQRRPQPHLRRIAGHAAVATRPARRGHRHRTRRVASPRRAHRACGAGRGDRAFMVGPAGLISRCAPSSGSSKTPGRPASPRPPHTCPQTPTLRSCTSRTPTPKPSHAAHATACWAAHTRRLTPRASRCAISQQAAQKLFADAQTRLGRPARLQARRGRVAQEVVAAAEGMDVLVLARDGDHEHLGPRSLGPAARFVVDHAPCRVLLIWPDVAPSVTMIPPPPGNQPPSPPR